MKALTGMPSWNDDVLNDLRLGVSDWWWESFDSVLCLDGEAFSVRDVG